MEGGGVILFLDLSILCFSLETVGLTGCNRCRRVVNWLKRWAIICEVEKWRMF